MAGAVLILSLSACSTSTTKKTETSFKDSERIASEKLALLTETVSQVSQDNPSFKSSSAIYLGGRVTKPMRNMSLPPVFNATVIQNHNFVSLRDATAWIAHISNLPVRISPEVIAPVIAQSAQPSQSNPIVPSISPYTPPAPSNVVAQQFMHAEFQGPLSAFIDLIAAHYNTHWKYENESVVFFNIETKTFVLNSIPTSLMNSSNISASTSSGGTPNNSSASSQPQSSGTSSTSATPASSGSNGGSTNTSGSSTTANSSLNIWSEIQGSIHQYLSAQGRVITNPSSGTITITDYPENVAKAGEYISQINDIMSLQATFQVKVLLVSMSDVDQYGINWNLVYKSLQNTFGVSASSAFPNTIGAGSYAFNILANNPSLNGTSAIINALTTQGKVSTVTTATVTTLNNLPIPYHNGNTTTYLAYSTSTVSTVGVTSSVMPGTYDTGFNMNLLPHILNLQHLLLQFNLNLGTLNKLTMVSNGTSTSSTSLQAPDLNNIGSMQYVSLKSGETLILSGFEQQGTNITSQGVGSASNYLLGGGKTSSIQKSVMVVLITPVISRRN